MSDVTDREVLDRLDHVGRMLADARELDGVRVRCGAWLLRTTLERAVVALVCAEGEQATRSVHALLLRLPKHVGQDLAADTSQLWHALRRASHHHDYEIAPTGDELRGWHEDTRWISEALLAAQPDLLPRPRVESASRRHG